MKKIILFFFIINSCSYPKMVSDEIIFFNDFEADNLTNINGGLISTYNESKVLGDFNNDGFTIHLNDIGNHDYIFISFDLYIHGTWDGNKNGFTENDRPDLWKIEFKPEMSAFGDPDNDYFVTTFSNSPCFSNYCLLQSYPENYPNTNRPQTGHLLKISEKKCQNSFFGGITTLYKIEKGFKSSGNAISIRFSDELYQPNAIDKDGVTQQKCDESWSLDNLEIRSINYE